MHYASESCTVLFTSDRSSYKRPVTVNEYYSRALAAPGYQKGYKETDHPHHAYVLATSAIELQKNEADEVERIAFARQIPPEIAHRSSGYHKTQTYVHACRRQKHTNSKAQNRTMIGSAHDMRQRCAVPLPSPLLIDVLWDIYRDLIQKTVLLDVTIIRSRVATSIPFARCDH